MKPMEYCLDSILIKLVEDWNNYGDERKELDCEILLTSFELPPEYRKHEFFVRLIERLIKDGNAELIKSRPFDSQIQNYQRNTIITIEGYYFIRRQGGYLDQRVNLLEERIRLKAIANQTLTLTWILALGAAPVALLALADLYWKYKWFQASDWWGMIILNIAVSVSTSYLVWILLQKKLLKKPKK